MLAGYRGGNVVQRGLQVFHYGKTVKSAVKLLSSLEIFAHCWNRSMIERDIERCWEYVERTENTGTDSDCCDSLPPGIRQTPVSGRETAVSAM